MKTILITGATSGIGKDLINILADKNQDWKTDAQQKIQKKNAEVAKREKELEQLLAQQYAEQDAIENQRKQKVGKKVDI